MAEIYRNSCNGKLEQLPIATNQRDGTTLVAMATASFFPLHQFEKSPSMVRGLFALNLAEN